MYYRIQYSNELYHYGITGQKWGIRRYQNPDGSLTPEGRLRYQKSDGSLNPEAKNFIKDNMWKYNSYISKNRNALEKKMHEELGNTKEAKAYTELMKNKRYITYNDGRKVDTSYMHIDWSDPKKAVDKMIEDMNIEYAYHKKDEEITNKYLNEYAGALLKDLGFTDNKAARNSVIKEFGILGEYSWDEASANKNTETYVDTENIDYARSRLKGKTYKNYKNK